MTSILQSIARAAALLSIALLFATGSAQAQPEIPRAGYYVEEKMLVKEGKEAWFVDYWQTKILPVFAQMPGYMGYKISTTTGDPAAAPGDEDFGPLLPLGPPDQVFIEHGGIQLRGVTTNTMIHFDSLLRGTYNFKVVHYWKDAESLRGLLPLFGPTWTRLNGDADPWGTLEKEYFANLENHWDTVFRIVAKSEERIISEQRR